MALEKHVVELTAKDSLSPAFQKIGQAAQKASDQAEQGAKKAARATTDWNSEAKKLGLGIGALVGTMAVLGRSHNNEETQLRALKAGFGETATEIDALAQEYQKLGIASDDQVRVAALLGQSLVTNYGMSTEAVKELIEVSANLAATSFDGQGQQIQLADAMQRVVAATRGEAEGVELLGLSLSDTFLATEAAKRGMDGWRTTMTEAEKAAFRLQMITEQSAYAVGAAGEAAQTTAGKTRAFVIQLEDMASGALGALGPVDDVLGALSQHATGIAMTGVALAGMGQGVSAVNNMTGALGKFNTAMKGSAMLGAVGPWAGLALGVGLAAGAIYYLTTRETEAEKQVKALDEATSGYTQTIVEQTTALANLSLLDEAQAMQTYLEVIKTDGAIAQERIDLITTAIGNLATISAQGGGEGLLAKAFQKDGEFFDVYVDQLLAVSGAYEDNIVTTLELEAVQAELRKGFDLTTTQATGLETAMTGVTKAMADPALFGSAMGEQASKILTDMYNGVLDVDRAITLLNDLPTDQAFNRAAAAALAAVPATDALTESLYGGVAALSDANLHLKSYKEILADAKAATEAETKAAIDLAKANSKTGFDKMTAGALAYQEQVDGAAEASKQLTADLDALGASLERNAGGAAAAAYDRVVGFTSGITASIQTTKDWADALFLPIDGLTVMDDLLSRGIIDAEDYAEAQKAQYQTTDALAESTDAMNEIQIKQASTLADGAMASADYLQNIAKLDEAEQALALAWADTDIAGRANDIAGMASEFGNMDGAQQAAFENMVLSAAATSQPLATVLEDAGLIKESLTDPSGWELVIDESDAMGSLADVSGGIGALIEVLGVAYGLDVNAILNDSEFWRQYNNLPDEHWISVRYNIGYTPELATGGMMPYEETAALGRVSGGKEALVGEHGPEIVKLHGGDMVIPNHASRYMDQGKGGGGVNFYGPVTVIANNPEQFMQQMRSYSTTMERR